MVQSLKESLRGCLEISLFLRRGVDRFDNSKAAFQQSCLIPLVLIPFNLPMALVDIELRELPLLSIFIVVLYRTIVGAFFYLGSVWVLSWPLERTAQFFHFASIFNWLSVSTTLAFLPLALFGLLGWADTIQFSILLLLTMGCCISFLAFSIHHSLKLNWWLATGLALYALVCEIMAAKMLWG